MALLAFLLWLALFGPDLVTNLAAGASVDPSVTGHEEHLPSMDGVEVSRMPSTLDMLLTWEPAATTLAVAAALVVGYALGVVILARRGDGCPWGRTIAWVGGVLSAVMVTATGIGSNGMVRRRRRRVPPQVP